MQRLIYPCLRVKQRNRPHSRQFFQTPGRKEHHTERPRRTWVEWSWHLWVPSWILFFSEFSIKIATSKVPCTSIRLNTWQYLEDGAHERPAVSSVQHLWHFILWNLSVVSWWNIIYNIQQMSVLEFHEPLEESKQICGGNWRDKNL